MKLKDFSKRIQRDISVASPRDRAVLTNIWLGFVIARKLVGSGPVAKLAELAKLVNPKVNHRIVEDCLDGAGEKLDWKEIRQYYDDEAQEVLPAPALVASLTGLLSGNARDARGELDSITEHVGVDHDIIALVDGWRTGSADLERVQSFEALRAAWADQSDAAAAILRHLQRIPRTENVDFIQVRECVQGKLGELKPKLDNLHVESTEVRALEDYLVNDRFRLSVLGEFKRGKSTLINALLERPDLMPTDTLPCTSALTEIRYGDKLRFAESERQGYPGTFEERDESAFNDNVGHADKRRHTREEAEEVAEKVPYWRVDCPASFLETSSIALIDSPGLGEDYARDAITTREAKRADAAVLVFNPEQAATLKELELIDDMGTHAENLFIVLNRADKIDEEEWERIADHVVKKAKDHTSTDFSERITFLSAKNAEDALKGGSKSRWLDDFDGFRERLADHLVTRAGAIKAGMLRSRVEILADQLDRQLTHEVTFRQQLLQEYSTLEVAKAKAEGQEAVAKIEVQKAYEQLQQKGSPVTEKLYRQFRDEAVPAAIAAMRSEMSEWTTKSSILKPKKLAKEIGEQAQETFLRSIASWAESAGAPVVSQGIAEAIEELVNKTQGLQAYLEEVGGLSADEYVGKLQARSLKNAFGGDIEIDAAEVAMKNALAGVLSLVLGYVIADIILYYILGLISGFLNPWLLAAAVVAAIPLTILGTGGVKNHIKEKIVKKIEEKMSRGDTLDDIRSGLSDAVDDIFEQLADGFKDSADELLREVSSQHTRTLVQLEEFEKKLGGDPDEKRKELVRIKQVANDARNTIKEMRGCIP